MMSTNTPVVPSFAWVTRVDQRRKQAGVSSGPTPCEAWRKKCNPPSDVPLQQQCLSGSIKKETDFHAKDEGLNSVTDDKDTSSEFIVVCRKKKKDKKRTSDRDSLSSKDTTGGHTSLFNLSEVNGHTMSEKNTKTHSAVTASGYCCDLLESSSKKSAISEKVLNFKADNKINVPKKNQRIKGKMSKLKSSNQIDLQDTKIKSRDEKTSDPPESQYIVNLEDFPEINKAGNTRLRYSSPVLSGSTEMNNQSRKIQCEKMKMEIVNADGRAAKSLSKFTKKKVRTKDPMEISLASLIKKHGLTRKKKEEASLKVCRRKKVTASSFNAYKGKQSEGFKRKKVTILKKHIAAKRKADFENFTSLLSALQRKATLLNANKTIPVNDLHHLIHNNIKDDSLECSFVNCETSGVQEIDGNPCKSKSPEHLEAVIPNKFIEFKCRTSSLVLNEEALQSKEHEHELLYEPTLNDGASVIENDCFTRTCQDLTREIEALNHPLHRRVFQSYCNHIVTSEIDNCATELIQRLVKFQERLHSEDPIKASSRRRYYCGLKEATKKMKKLSLIIVSPNIKTSGASDGLNDSVKTLLSEADRIGVPVVFALSCRRLAKLTHKSFLVSAFSVANYDGAQEYFFKLLSLIPEAKVKYEVSLQQGRLPFHDTVKGNTQDIT